MATDPKKRKPAPAAPHPAIAPLREKIDALDAELVRLINQRAEVGREIGLLKARHGVKPYAPARETQVYHRIASLNKGPLPNESLRSIYREIISATLALERPIRVAYFGQPGSFTHLAARVKFGSSVEYLPGREIRDVFGAVSRGQADYGVVPIENSTEGGVNQSVDQFAETRLKVVGEVYLPIHQHLLARGAVRDVKVVYSHPQGFAQCRAWLTGCLANAERKEVGSTSEAAERAAREPRAAAIAGVLAAEIYGVPVRVQNIEDQADNITRFFVIGENICERTGKDKTSLLVSIKDAPGALLHLLRPLERHKINLTRIESRPSRRRAWDYHFFIDLQGHRDDPDIRAAFDEVESQARHVEVLGSYPAADPHPSAEVHAALRQRIAEL